MAGVARLFGYMIGLRTRSNNGLKFRNLYALVGGSYIAGDRRWWRIHDVERGTIKTLNGVRANPAETRQ